MKWGQSEAVLTPFQGAENLCHIGKIYSAFRNMVIRMETERLGGSSWMKVGSIGSASGQMNPAALSQMTMRSGSAISPDKIPGTQFTQLSD